MTTVFHLIRHAEHVGAPGTLAGRLPGLGLTPAGQAQATTLAAWLCGKPVTAVHTSPMERCQQTAAPLAAALGVTTVVSAALIEIDFGDWAGQSFAALAGEPAWQRWNDSRDTAATPAGETMAAVQARAAGWLAGLQPHRGDVAIVSHADIIKAVVALVLGLPLQSYERLEVDQASVTSIALWPGGGRLLSLNGKAWRA